MPRMRTEFHIYMKLYFISVRCIWYIFEVERSVYKIHLIIISHVMCKFVSVFHY